MMPGIVAAIGAAPLMPDGATTLLVAGGEEVAMIAIIMGTIGSVAFPLVRALARRLESRSGDGGALRGDDAERLERMERAIESIAIEVERISEAQRFTTKLLAERTPTPPSEPAP
jgi:Zn-dependent protease with chaperone function